MLTRSGRVSVSPCWRSNTLISCISFILPMWLVLIPFPIFQLALGLLRFGFVAIYLTEPLVRGFTTAAAVHVVVSQLKYLLGVKTQRFSGPLSAIYVRFYLAVVQLCVRNDCRDHKWLCACPQSVTAVLSHIASTNVPTVIMGLVCIVFLYAVKDLNERFKKKLPIPIPGEIIVVIVSTGVSYGLSLSEVYKVEVVGKIPTG